MAQDDWRVRVEMEEERHATDFLARLGLDLGSEARELAKDLEDHRLAVSNDEGWLATSVSEARSPGCSRGRPSSVCSLACATGRLA